MLRKIGIIVLSLLCFQMGHAFKLKAKYPKRYVVQEGDTLWGIADKFLLEPWEWEQLWKTNPQLKDPTKIYPGMVIEIKRVDGKPILALSRGPTVKLAPKVRSMTIPHPIPPVHLEMVHHFLLPSTVLTKKQLGSLPHIIDFHNENIAGGPPYTMYTSELKQGRSGDKYTVFRPTEPYYDIDEHETLGYAAEYIGEATLLHTGAPASFKIDKSKTEVRIGDKLMLVDPYDFPPLFIPKAPPKKMEGRIISNHGELLVSGKHQIVVINRGKREGVKRGFVFAVYEPKRLKEDPVDPRRVYEIPEERIGEILVFNVFEKVSLALVMKSTEEIRKNDKIFNP